MQILTNNITLNQQNSLFGNRCGFKKHEHRIFKTPTKHKNRFPILVQLVERINYCSQLHKNAYSIFASESRLPKSLAYLLDKIKKNGWFRQSRGESREAKGIVLSTLVHHLNLNTFYIGFMDQSKRFIHLSIAYLVKASGLSKTRFKRAFRSLKKEGIIDVTMKHRKTKEGIFYSDSFKIKVNPAIFDEFGFSKEEQAKYISQFRYREEDELARAQKKAYKAEREQLAREKERANRANRKAIKHQRTFVRDEPRPFCPDVTGIHEKNKLDTTYQKTETGSKALAGMLSMLGIKRPLSNTS